MTLMNARNLIQVRDVEVTAIPALREEILNRVGASYAILLERANAYALTAEESAALQELRSLDFLSGDE